MDDKLLEEQRQLEQQDSVELGRQRYIRAANAARKRGSEAETGAGRRLVNRVVTRVAARIQSYLQEQDAKSGKRRIATAYKYLRGLDATTIAVITARRCISAIPRRDRLTYVVLDIAQALKDNGADRGLIWSPQDMVKVGAQLVQIFEVETGLISTYNERLPYKKETRKLVIGTLKAAEELTREHARCELLSPFKLPTVLPPRTWTSARDGGYHYTPLRLIKSDSEDYLAELQVAEIPEVLTAINAVQATPWAINHDVLVTMRTAWDRGGGDTLPRREGRARGKLAGECTKINTQLWLAEKFDGKTIYFPHQLDWRGRLNPVPVLLNPQEDDRARGLLQFAEGKALGKRGAYWLAVHIANLFAVNKIDKAPFDARVRWVAENEVDIVASANGGQYWTRADKPWQALAACLEWARYKKQGVAFKSHLPVALDGSCNGMQHLSALMRDTISGQAVNLLPSDKPADLYQQVADVVVDKVDREVWTGHIDRKLVKSAVMTLPYGVTEHGLVEHLRDFLDDSKNKAYLPKNGNKPTMQACNHLAEIIKSATSTIVPAAMDALEWLKNVAESTASETFPVLWRTPAGLPVHQDYRKRELIARVAVPQGKLNLTRITNRLDKARQKRGLAANFVHSLDAAHLMRTVNKAMAADQWTSFAMIHDSYGSHASDVDHMLQLVREAFVEIHADDLLDTLGLGSRFVLSDTRQDVPEPPEPGELDLREVLRSTYFFS